MSEQERAEEEETPGAGAVQPGQPDVSTTPPAEEAEGDVQTDAVTPEDGEPKDAPAQQD